MGWRGNSVEWRGIIVPTKVELYYDNWFLKTSNSNIKKICVSEMRMNGKKITMRWSTVASSFPEISVPGLKLAFSCLTTSYYFHHDYKELHLPHEERDLHAGLFRDVLLQYETVSMKAFVYKSYEIVNRLSGVFSCWFISIDTHGIYIIDKFGLMTETSVCLIMAK